jgi:biotin operon repressor
MRTDFTPRLFMDPQEDAAAAAAQVESAKELVKTYEKLKNEGREILDISKQLLSFSTNLEKSIQKRLDKTSTVKDLTKSLTQLEQDFEKNQRNSAATLAKIGNNRAIALTKARDLAQQEHRIKNEIISLENTISDKIQERNAFERAGDTDRAKTLAREIKEETRILELKEKETKKIINQKEEQKGLIKQLDQAKKIHNDTLTQQGKEIGLTKDAITQKKQGTVLDAISEKFNLKQVQDMFTIAGLFKVMIDAAFRFSKISTDISHNIGYGADKADEMATKFVDVAQNSSNINVTLANLGEAMNQLNEATGFVANYSADALETQVMLTKQFGLSGEEAAGIYKFSVLTGKSSAEVNDNMVGAFVNMRNQLKAGVPFKAVMAEAAKVSGQLAANLGNNPTAIVKAVTQAKALGTTLEQVKNQGEALLNFETSLENELKAELLTGKQLNLERARAAALAGDQVTLAQELNKNVGSLEDFQKMNVLQQKSLAEAVGLTTDQLADQLRKQKLSQETGKSLAQITKEEALEAEQRQAIQDKFNQTILKLQDVIGNLVAGPLSMFLDGLSTALKIVGYIVKPIEWIGSLAELIGEKFGQWSEALGPFSFILKGIAGIAILIAAYGAFAALAWIPVVGPILGAAAAVAVMAKGFSALSAQKAGDMISPADGKTQVSTKEGGLFELSKNDDLVAGPGLADKNSSSVNGGSIDITPMVTAINEVKAAVKELMNRPVIINMDSKQVGTNLVQNASYKSA